MIGEKLNKLRWKVMEKELIELKSMESECRPRATSSSSAKQLPTPDVSQLLETSVEARPGPLTGAVLSIGCCPQSNMEEFGT